jgi:hypothetical protein
MRTLSSAYLMSWESSCYTEPMDGVSIERARVAKAHVLERFEKVPQVGAVGLIRVGEGYGLKINLSEPLKSGEAIPPEFEGVPILIDVTGRVVAR